MIKQNIEKLNATKQQLNEFIRSELRTLLQFFFNSFPSCKVFGRLDQNEINKLIVLQKASELDIPIPETYVLTKKKQLLDIPKDSITKAISNGPGIQFNDDHYSGYTALVDVHADHIQETFSPSLVQELVHKKFEIRSFLLNDQIYSMAILSQADPQTQLDFRLYNYRFPNRTVPYKLPRILEEKLVKLAMHFNLGSASFDLIKTMDNKYIFLEVNPGGQFGMVSHPCNYYLERELANSLINRI